MASWTAGYVADLDYTQGFYRELTPALLAFVAMAHAQAAPDVSGSLTYCELGCGRGFTANLLAAANPHIAFHANDFNPGHIVGARRLARAAGSDNIQFYDHSFAEFLDAPEVPDFDIIALHGIYSWISAENRAVIVEFLRRKLRPGGLVYVSYNCQPGWSLAAPLRHLMALHGQARGGPTAGRIEPALDFIQSLVDVNAGYFRGQPSLVDRLAKLKGQPRNYLAHEYMNDDWTLFYHSDVAQEMSEAKLTFLASAHVLDSIDNITVTPEQGRLLAGIESAAFRETVRDYMVGQQFRRDVFVRGPLLQTSGDVTAAWDQMRVALTSAREDVPEKITVAQGDVALDPAVYGPILDALETGLKTCREVMDAVGTPPGGASHLRQVIAILIGAGHVQPCLPSPPDETRVRRAEAFNAAVLNQARAHGELQALVSPVIGGGVSLNRFQQLFLLALCEGERDPSAFVGAILEAQGQSLVKDGQPLVTSAENQAELKIRYEQFVARDLPVLERLGIA